MNPSSMPRPKYQDVLGLLGWLALCFAASALGAVASVNAKDFYKALVSPSWAPPGWVFGPVWTVLFICMAVAAWLVWRSAGDQKSRRIALGLFVAQLAANCLWSWLFFAWRLGGVAFAEVLLLWVLIACTAVAFWRIKPLAGALFMPYLAWVSFAAVLNWVLWRGNMGVLG